MSNDPWAHRSQGMRCKTCMWYAPKVLPVDETKSVMERALYDKDVQPERLGRCRRHAPTMNGFPAVWSDDWCGDHKLDETKAG